MSSSALLIRVTGHDRPGLTHALTSILARYEVRVLDLGQAVIHDGLAFGILIELPESLRSSALLTDLLSAVGADQAVVLISHAAGPQGLVDRTVRIHEGRLVS